MPKTIPTISIELPSSGGNIIYNLNTIIYFGMNHFTCCFLDGDKNIWFHDGQKNNGNPTFFQNIDHVEMSDLV